MCLQIYLRAPDQEHLSLITNTEMGALSLVCLMLHLVTSPWPVFIAVQYLYRQQQRAPQVLWNAIPTSHGCLNWNSCPELETKEGAITAGKCILAAKLESSGVISLISRLHDCNSENGCTSAGPTVQIAQTSNTRLGDSIDDAWCSYRAWRFQNKYKCSYTLNWKGQKGPLANHFNLKPDLINKYAWKWNMT